MSSKIKLKNFQLSQLIEHTYDSIISTDLDGFIQSYNKGSTLLFGYNPNEILGKHITIFQKETTEEDFQTKVSRLLKREHIIYDTYITTKDNKQKYISLSVSVVKDKKNQPIGFVGHAKDITYLRETQLHLEESNQNLQNYLDAIDTLDIGIFVVDENFKITYMNNTVKKWFGDKVGEKCYSSIADIQTPCKYCKMHNIIHKQQTIFYEPITIGANSYEVVATSLKNVDGSISKIEVIRNVTEQKKAKEALILEKKKFDYLAHHDTLTNLPNRALFYDRLSQCIKNAKHNKSLLALLFIDLDHFKEINDSLGHEIGDEVLKIVALRLKELIKVRDTLARLGGDEFIMILEGLSEHNDASVIAQRILEVLSAPIVINMHTLYISSSIGISVYPDDGISSTNLLKYADSAMYKAKKEGRNNYQYYNTTMTEQAYDRVLMEASLRDAIKNEDFIVYYQPQIDASTNTPQLIGMEALVRWKSQDGEIITPYKFIPLAETTGLIVPLDRVVMKIALQQLSSWYKAGHKPGVLALNLATQQLEKEDFVEFFHALLTTYKIDPKWIELEVTESQIMKNPEESIKKLQQLSDLGISLAIDDFGTGYSSLAYLKKLPIDKLKIDQAFIRGLPNDEDDAAIAKAVIALANSLKLNIIAEGVETEAQRDFVVENGCKNIQGYFYSKPIPAEEFEVWLKKE